MPGAAAVFDDINGDCDIAHNRFVGVLSFYGQPGAALNVDQRNRLVQIGKQVKLQALTAQLRLCENTMSQLTIGAARLQNLMQGAATGLFETATLAGNMITEPLNLFVACHMLALSGSTMQAQPPENAPYGIFISERASAVGNITMLPTRKDLPIIFAAPSFAEAGNMAFIQS
jgi:hypothetical protein